MLASPPFKERYEYGVVDEMDGLPVDERTRFTSLVPSSFQRSTFKTNME